MVYLNEWFPNPAGDDAAGEFVELYNQGTTPASLDRYAIGTGAKRRFSLTGRTIPPEGFLTLRRADTKLTLKNTDGELFLYGPDGRVLDHAGFKGSAPEGKSFSRMDYGNAQEVGHFAFADPTPGAKNQVAGTLVSSVSYPVGVPLDPAPTISSVMLFGVGAALAILLISIYIISKNEDLSHCLFGGDPEAR